MARVVAAGIPHHVTQRGNRRQERFFSDDDYQVYREVMAQWCSLWAVEVWAYCLMSTEWQTESLLILRVLALVLLVVALLLLPAEAAVVSLGR